MGAGGWQATKSMRRAVSGLGLLRLHHQKVKVVESALASLLKVDAVGTHSGLH